VVHHELEETDVTFGRVDNLLGLIPAMKKAPDIDPPTCQDASSFDFDGEGKTERAGTLKGTLRVRVKQKCQTAICSSKARKS